MRTLLPQCRQPTPAPAHAIRAARPEPKLARGPVHVVEHRREVEARELRGQSLGRLNAGGARDRHLDGGESRRARGRSTGGRINAGRALDAAGEVVERRRQLVEAPPRFLGANRDSLDDRQQAGGWIRCWGLHPGAILAQPAPRILGCMSPFWIWTQAAIVVFVLAGIVLGIIKLV
jgi:hypothetical protein